MLGNEDVCMELSGSHEISYSEVLLTSYKLRELTLDHFVRERDVFLKEPISAPPHGLCENGFLTPFTLEEFLLILLQRCLP